MKRSTLLLLGIVGVVIVWLVCVWWHRAGIEGDLAGRTGESLQVAGFPTGLVAFEGRDAYLRGTVATEAEKQRAGDAAAAIYGVRRVFNELTVSGLPDRTAPAPEPVEPPTAEPAEANAETDSAFAPEPAEVAAQAQEAVAIEARIAEMLERDVIEFQTGTATLAAESRTLLDEIATELARVPAIAVDVEGHTDSQGAAASNQALSQQRAEAVVAYLVERGLRAERFRAIGYGADRPVASNETAAGRARNRRVEFNLQGN